MSKYSRELDALYTECPRKEKIQCWVVSIINLSMIGMGMTYLISTWEHSRIDVWMIPPLLFVSVLIADFTSGVLHWTTDTYLDEIRLRRVTSIAREHHFNPHNILKYSYLDYVSFGSLGSIILVGPPMVLTMVALPPSTLVHLVVMSFSIIAVCMYFAVHAHRMGHQWSNIAPIRILQKLRILHSPKHHLAHHKSPHLIRYCAFTGWANPLCDKFRVWRGFEIAINAIFKIPPRKNEREWDIRIEAGLPFLLDPVPSLIELRRKELVK